MQKPVFWIWTWEAQVYPCMGFGLRYTLAWIHARWGDWQSLQFLFTKQQKKSWSLQHKTKPNSIGLNEFFFRFCHRSRGSKLGQYRKNYPCLTAFTGVLLLNCFWCLQQFPPPVRAWWWGRCCRHQSLNRVTPRPVVQGVTEVQKRTDHSLLLERVILLAIHRPDTP